MKNIVLSIILLTIFSIVGKAQISGISGSKLGSVTVDVVDNKKIEFEPGFFHSRSSKKWNSQGDLENLFSTSDSSRFVTGMYFRFTYGLWDKLEIGMSVSTDLSALGLGARYVFFNKEKWGLGAIAGANVPMGNRTIDQAVRVSANLTQAGGGLVGSFYFTPNLSLDVTTQYMHFIKKSVDDDKGALFINSDLGYYILDHQLQLIGGLGFRNIINNAGTHQVLTVYPGITVETGKNFILVLSMPFDIYGKDETKNLAFNFALTLTFN